MSRRDAEHVFQSLRSGAVPERGLEAFAVGIERQRKELHRLFDFVAGGEGAVKFLRGGYGAGKTFMARLATLDARGQNFATSFVVVSDNDLHFHKFDDVYRKVVTELATQSCPRGALGDILDRWVGRVEDAMIAAGADEAAPDFDAKVRARIGEELVSMTRGAAPEDFVRVVQAWFDHKQRGELAEAGALLSWLAGSGNVAASARKGAAIKGEITSRDALAYLRGIVEIVKAAGYRGLVIVIDEAETILRMRADVRGKSLNGIRQIHDDVSSWSNLLWIFTGTPDFFDSRRGVAGLEPLHARIRFLKQDGFATLRQAQLELLPFTPERLREVALKLRELYPTEDRARLEQRMRRELIEQLVAETTTGFRGDVGVVPRQFLRLFVDQMDHLEEDPDWTPSADAVAVAPGEAVPAPPDEPDDAAFIPEETVW